MSGSTSSGPHRARVPDDVVIGRAFRGARRVLLAMCGATLLLVALAAAAIAMASGQPGAANAALLVLGSTALVALVAAAFAFRALLGTTNRASAIAHQEKLGRALGYLSRIAIVVDIAAMACCVLVITPTANAAVAGGLCLVICVQLPVLMGALRRTLPGATTGAKKPR